MKVRNKSILHKYFAFSYHCPIEGLMLYGEDCGCLDDKVIVVMEEEE